MGFESMNSGLKPIPYNLQSWFTGSLERFLRERNPICPVYVLCDGQAMTVLQR